MSESNYIVVKPDLRYKSAPDADLSFVTELNQTQNIRSISKKIND